MFPDKMDQLNWSFIEKMEVEGRYESNGNNGLLNLFEDLQRMVDNSKQFNSSNICFLPWRCADMMDKALLDLRTDLGKLHGIEEIAQFSATVEEIEFSQKENNFEL